MDKIEGKIAAILDKTTVVINRGSDHGVEHGTEFYIYTKIGPFFDPDTGDNLGETTKVWGKVRASIVENRFSVAKTEYSVKFSIDPQSILAKFFGTIRIELPVDESDIEITVQKIKVGFPVLSIPKPKIEAIAQDKPLLLSNDESISPASEGGGCGEWQESVSDNSDSTEKPPIVKDDTLSDKDMPQAKNKD